MDSNLSPKTYVIPAAGAAGSEASFDLTGGFFVITDSTAAISIKAEVIDTADGSARGELEYTPYQAGQGFQLAAGEKFKRLWLKNLSANPNTVTIFYGVGRLIDARKAISIDAASITALAAAINAPQRLKPVCEQIPAGGAARAYSGFKSIEIVAIAGAAPGVVNITSLSGSMNFNIPSGDGEEFSAETDINFIDDITVTPDANTIAQVTGLKL